MQGKSKTLKLLKGMKKKEKRKKEKQIYTESVKGKMRGRLSLVFFPPNCYFGRRNKLGRLLGQVSQKTA